MDILNINNDRGPKIKIRHPFSVFGPRSSVFCALLTVMVIGAGTVWGDTTVRVRVVKDVSPLDISSNGDYILQSTADNKHNAANKHVIVSIRRGNIYVDGKSAGESVTVLPQNEGTFVTIGKRNYRGKIVLYGSGTDRMLAVNYVNMEEYIRGVLPVEVSSNWPIEALKAQAIVARTYALWTMSRHAREGYDLCNEVHCQVYRGANGEADSTNEAVISTKEVILTFEGKPIAAYYHSNCGGATEDSDNVWGGKTLPYLKGVECDWGRNVPNYHWKKFVYASVIETALRHEGYDLKKIRDIEVAKTSRHGRATHLAFVHKHGKNIMRAATFRMLLGPNVIRSTFFTNIERKSGGWEFAGRGWGHGIGLCQWGAYGMAKAGHGYKDILSYYYKGAEIQNQKSE